MATVVGTHNPLVHRATCPACASIIEYVDHELRLVPLRTTPGSIVNDERLTCPKCSKEFVVGERWVAR